MMMMMMMMMMSEVGHLTIFRKDIYKAYERRQVSSEEHLHAARQTVE